LIFHHHPANIDVQFVGNFITEVSAENTYQAIFVHTLVFGLYFSPLHIQEMPLAMQETPLRPNSICSVNVHWLPSGSHTCAEFRCFSPFSPLVMQILPQSIVALALERVSFMAAIMDSWFVW
jgi:hypothetical protein